MRRALLCLAAATALLPIFPARAASTINVNVRDADVVDVIRLLGIQAGVNVVPDGSIHHDHITMRLQGITFDVALMALARAYDLQVRKEGGVLLVGSATSMNRRFSETGARDGLSTRTVVYPIKNAKAEDLVKPLTDALIPGTVVIADRRTSALIVTGSEPTLSRAGTLLSALDAPVSEYGTRNTQTMALRNVKASEAMRLLKGLIPDGFASADDRQNAIVANGSTSDLTLLRTLLDEFDKPSRQVMFEVKVIDVTPVNDSSNVGIKFGGVDLLGQPTQGATSFAFTRSSLQLNATINFLVSKGNAKVLATPRLVTVNNREASLLIGETYPIIYFDIRSGNQQIQTIDIGVKLRMTPTIGADGSIMAELHPEYSEIQGFQQSYPIIASRRVDSTLRVRDGETIVLGGLLREITSETVTKLPILGDVPILGSVFRNRERNSQRDEIVFLITPHIVTDVRKEAS